MRRIALIVPLLAVLFAVGSGQSAFAEALTSRGQTVYVPIYSEISYGDRKNTLNLSATLSVRNTDRKSAIRITRVDYYSATGSLVRSYLKDAQTLSPMASVEYIITGADRSGGTAASFVVEWESGAPVSPPVVEAVMLSAASIYGISFISSGHVLEDRH
jgi:ABC-type oligopeptide transport system substrate-binding subunit